MFFGSAVSAGVVDDAAAALSTFDALVLGVTCLLSCTSGLFSSRQSSSTHPVDDDGEKRWGLKRWENRVGKTKGRCWEMRERWIYRFHLKCSVSWESRSLLEFSISFWTAFFPFAFSHVPALLNSSLDSPTDPAIRYYWFFRLFHFAARKWDLQRCKEVKVLFGRERGRKTFPHTKSRGVSLIYYSVWN